MFTVQVYTVYGQPGAPAVVPTSLTSVPLAQYDTQAPAHDTNKDKLPATDDKTTGVKSNQASKKKNKRTRNRNKKTPGEVRGDQDENDDALEPESSAQSAEMDALATGGPAFWASLGSSDSDYSDTEGGSSSKLPSIASRVRVCALACFHALIKVNILMSYPGCMSCCMHVWTATFEKLSLLKPDPIQNDHDMLACLS